MSAPPAPRPPMAPDLPAEVDTGPAEVDARLPLLGTALDRRAVAALFERRWPAASSAATSVTTVTAGASCSTSYQPGTRCVTTYPLSAQVPSGPAVRTIGVVEVTPTGLTHRLYDEDPHLPALRRASDAEGMRRLLAGVCAAPPTSCTVAPVRYRPGSRCVLRYELATPAGAQVLYGKVLASDAEWLAAVLRRLDGPLVAPLLGYLPEVSMILQRAVRGEDLSSRAFAETTPAAERATLLREVGALLAGLHASAGAPAPTRTLAQDVAELRSYLPIARAARPAIGERLARAVDLVASHAEGAGEPVPSHGSFRTGQVVVKEGRPVMVDLDGFCWAEPARDVGNLLAYLTWRAVRRPEQARAVAEARHAFLAGYRGARRDLDPCRRRLMEAVAMLKIAGRRFRSLAVDEWPHLPRLLTAAESLLATGRRPARGGTAPPQGGPAPARGEQGLAGLDLALDTAVMTRQLRPLVEASSPVVASARVLGGKPGYRSVIEYQLSEISTGVPERLIGKLYAERRRAVRLYELMRRLRSDVFLPESPLGVAEPVGVLPWLAMAVYLPVDGPFLDQVPDEERACRFARLAGRWLAVLHASSLTLDRKLEVSTEVTNAGLWAALVGERLPEAGPTARHLAERLARAADSLTVRVDTPIHKDFHHRHVIAGARLVVIDLDEARMGDPAFDIAHFCANLRLIALSDREGAPDPALLRRSFLEGYGHRPREDAFRFFYAYTCLKIAKQLVTGRGPQVRPQGGEWRRQLRTMLREGHACLAP